MATKYNGKTIKNLAQWLINAQGSPAEQAARNVGASPIYNEDQSEIFGFDWGNKTPTTEDMDNIQSEIDRIEGVQDITNGVSLPQLGQLGVGAVREHPFKSMALAGSAAGNLGGLMDNNKFGGQLAGLGIGALGSQLLGNYMGPYGKIMMTMGGGHLGALFDKLRAKKEQEQQAAQSYGRV